MDYIFHVVISIEPSASQPDRLLFPLSTNRPSRLGHYCVRHRPKWLLVGTVRDKSYRDVSEVHTEIIHARPGIRNAERRVSDRDGDDRRRQQHLFRFIRASGTHSSACRNVCIRVLISRYTSLQPPLPSLSPTSLCLSRRMSIAPRSLLRQARATLARTHPSSSPLPMSRRSSSTGVSVTTLTKSSSPDVFHVSPAPSSPRQRAEHWANSKGTKFKDPWDSFRHPVSRPEPFSPATLYWDRR